MAPWVTGLVVTGLVLHRAASPTVRRGRRDSANRRRDSANRPWARQHGLGSMGCASRAMMCDMMPCAPSWPGASRGRHECWVGALNDTSAAMMAASVVECRGCRAAAGHLRGPGLGCVTSCFLAVALTRLVLFGLLNSALSFYSPSSLCLVHILLHCLCTRKTEQAHVPGHVLCRGHSTFNFCTSGAWRSKPRVINATLAMRHCDVWRHMAMCVETHGYVSMHGYVSVFTCSHSANGGD
jgi:hypothetical protein